MQHLYIAMTATPCFVGRTIRLLTGARYNHVSICLEPSLKRLYSFARRYKNTPLCGGFVEESAKRYVQNGRVAGLTLFKIPLTDSEYEHLKSQIENFLSEKREYVYNNFSAVASLMHVRIRVKNAYTCVEYVTDTLKCLCATKGILKSKYYSVESLREALSDFIVYKGAFPVRNTDWGNDRFCETLSPMGVCKEEIADNGRLLANLIVTLYPSAEDSRIMQGVRDRLDRIKTHESQKVIRVKH